MTKTKRTTVLLLVWALSLGQPCTLTAADLTAKAVAAFDRYVSLTERRLDTVGAPFLWVEALPTPQRDVRLHSLREGDLVVERLTTKDGNKEIGVDHGMIHHWIGIVFVPGVTLDAAVALLQDYDHHRQIYDPNVADSRRLSRNGDDFTFRARFVMKRIVTVVVNSEHEARFTRDGPTRASSRIHSTRIAEVEAAGSAAEHETPPGHDNGYLWRLNSYWRFLARDGGVYIQCETVTLTRDVPVGVGWLIRPFVTSIPRETLTFTLDRTRHALTTATR